MNTNCCENCWEYGAKQKDLHGPYFCKNSSCPCHKSAETRTLTMVGSKPYPLQFSATDTAELSKEMKAKLQTGAKRFARDFTETMQQLAEEDTDTAEKKVCSFHKYTASVPLLPCPGCMAVPTTDTSDWRNGELMFDAIITLCNLKDVDTWDEGLTLSFVPKNVTGKAWKELKEKMRQITEK